MSYKLVVADGDYVYEPETGKYSSKDLVLKYKNKRLFEALRDFQDYAESGDEATLSYKPKKSKEV